MLFCFFSLFGCGMTITQDSAQRSVDDARVAVESAKESRADLYSTSDLRQAERLLTEARQALSRNRRQRAYTLATRAEKSARAAEEEAKKRLEMETAQVSLPTEVLPTTVTPTSPIQPTVTTQRPSEIPYTTIVSPPPVSPLPVQPIPIPSGVPVQTSTLTSDIENRIQAAVQALEAAQNAVKAAQLLVSKIQVEIGLSRVETAIQQVRVTGAPAEVVNLIQSWYDQARQAATAGNYETALRFLERAQAYVQAIVTPIQ